MPARADSFDLAAQSLRSGEARRIDLEVPLGAFTFGTDLYVAHPALVPVRLDLSRMVGNGWALRLRFSASLRGPCMRCLESAAPVFTVDAREIDQPGSDDEELSSPYVVGTEIDLHAWAHDAFALALPTQVLCREDCAGLCPRCGANLNAEPGHAHEAEIDPRWAKLGELKFD
ncbi:MAG TPA: DUF177 domain-containing protein [Solirubrobacteraceae bacterium]